jgi:hypothetical protein
MRPSRAAEKGVRRPAYSGRLTGGRSVLFLGRTEVGETFELKVIDEVSSSLVDVEDRRRFARIVLSSAFETPRGQQFRRIQMLEVRTQPQAKCPIRPADPCSLCVPGASGPADCGLVYLVMSDPDLRDRLHQIRTAPL